MIRLLIADDERMEREALADIVMRRFEHEVTVEMAENGRKAADTAVLWGADLILMDIQMPVMDGYEATRRIRALPRPDAYTVPIIAMTANAFSEDIEKALASGMNDVATKPLDIKLLLKKMEIIREREEQL